MYNIGDKVKVTNPYDKKDVNEGVIEVIGIHPYLFSTIYGIEIGEEELLYCSGDCLEIID